MGGLATTLASVGKGTEESLGQARHRARLGTNAARRTAVVEARDAA